MAPAVLLALLLASLPLLPGLAQEDTSSTLLDIAADPDAFRDIPWSHTMQEVADAEGGRLRTSSVVVSGEGIVLYDLAVSRITYRFDPDGALQAREFLLRKSNSAAFTSLYYSLFRRYGFPVLTKAKSAVWYVQGISISLVLGDSLTCTFTYMQPAQP